MELHGIGLLTEDAVGRVDHAGRRGQYSGVIGQDRDRVAVRHPDRTLRRNTVEKRVALFHLEFRPAVLARTGAFHRPAVVVGEILGAVADAQQGQASLDAAQVDLRRIARRNGAGTSGKDHAIDRIVERRDLVEGMDFAIDVEFAEAPADELGHLGAEIEDENLFNHATKIM